MLDCKITYYSKFHVTFSINNSPVRLLVNKYLHAHQINTSANLSLLIANQYSNNYSKQLPTGDSQPAKSEPRIPSYGVNTDRSDRYTVTRRKPAANPLALFPARRRFRECRGDSAKFFNGPRRHISFLLPPPPPTGPFSLWFRCSAQLCSAASTSPPSFFSRAVISLSRGKLWNFHILLPSHLQRCPSARK